MVYLNADGTVTQTKPFSLIGSIASIFTFFGELVSVFFDSILSTKKDVAARRNREPNSSNYNSRNYGNNNSQLRGRGANVRGMSNLVKDANAGPCGGGG
mmetsp:Transcript_8832/g.17879  ORF Transcript_8832/g.17879 Transcript_8832/m.17879 type:complete len:99 (-) Transcript_8832:233-529(-)